MIAAVFAEPDLPFRAISQMPFTAGPGPRASDRRWPAVRRRIKALRERGRRSIRIVDAGCGAGELLIAAARYARTLGFVAIEGRGIDDDPRRIAHARQAATGQDDPAIGLVFERREVGSVLREECEFPVDLLLCPTPGARKRALADLAQAAAGVTLWEPHDTAEAGRR